VTSGDSHGHEAVCQPRTVVSAGDADERDRRRGLRRSSRGADRSKLTAESARHTVETAGVHAKSRSRWTRGRRLYPSAYTARRGHSPTASKRASAAAHLGVWGSRTHNALRPRAHTVDRRRAGGFEWSESPPGAMRNASTAAVVVDRKRGALRPVVRLRPYDTRKVRKLVVMDPPPSTVRVALRLNGRAARSAFLPNDCGGRRAFSCVLRGRSRDP